jgi:hypothetical protein
MCPLPRPSPAPPKKQHALPLPSNLPFKQGDAPVCFHSDSISEALPCILKVGGFIIASSFDGAADALEAAAADPAHPPHLTAELAERVALLRRLSPIAYDLTMAGPLDQKARVYQTRILRNLLLAALFPGYEDDVRRVARGESPFLRPRVGRRTQVCTGGIGPCQWTLRLLERAA